MAPMGDAAKAPYIDYDAYLALERETDRKHEWLDGQVYAMAGGTPPHGALSVAVGAELRALALRCGCQVFSSDGKIRVPATELASYPDVSVVCGPLELDAKDPNAITNPAVLVEVLSDGTEAYDRGEKFAHYRRLASLQCYLLVSQHEPRLECYTRDTEGRWIFEEAGPGATLHVAALKGSLEVDRVYAGIELTAPARRGG